MSIIDPIIKAVKNGYHAILASGNIHDYIIEDDRIVFRPYFVAERLFSMGYIIIRYSRSTGAYLYKSSSIDTKCLQKLNVRLKSAGVEILLTKKRDTTPEEIKQFFRGISRLLMANSNVNNEMKIAVIVDYVEHLAPVVNTSAAASEDQIFTAESLHALAMSPALHKSNNVLICFVRDGLQNSLLNDLYRVSYSYPKEEEMINFVHLAKNKKDLHGNLQYGLLEPGLSLKEYSRLTKGLPIRIVESLFRESMAENKPITRNRILCAKAESVLNASEGTLEIVKSQLTLNDIVGLDVVKKIFVQFAEKLKNGNQASPRGILMVGPPGTAKSSFASILAQMAGFNLLQFKDIKNMFVGESERRLNLALSLIESLSPAILFIDEITEMMPSRRTEQLDGGVSQNILGRLFQFSAREDLRGRVLILAASNVAERLDFAWHDRFIIVPFLELVPDEMCILFGIFERRLTGKTSLAHKDIKIIEAAQLLHKKGASPRKCFDIVNHALSFVKNGELTSQDILSAAYDYLGTVNPFSVAITSLSAISLTSFYSFFPWSQDPENYIFPWYLEGIVDKKTGIVDRNELYKRIQEYKNQLDW